jgi:hypothetical protein
MKSVNTIAWTLALLATSALAQVPPPQPPSNTAAEGVAPAPATNAPPTFKDVLLFLNGDILHGSLISVDPKSGVRWRHPGMKQALQISPASVARISIDHPQATNSAQNRDCLARLTNGDELSGKLAALDSEKLTLETWYGGALTIPRKRIQSLIPGQNKSAYIYEGPAGMEGWTVKGGNGGDIDRAIQQFLGGKTPQLNVAWRYSNGGFISSGNGTIGRGFDFPAKVCVDFDVAWRGYLSLILGLFGESVESVSSEGYMLQLNRGSTYLQHISRAGSSMPVQSANAGALSQPQGKAHISLRADKETKRIFLFVNGERIKEWVDPGDFATGRNIVFSQQSQGATKISDLKITAWDGKIEADTGAEKKTQQDFVKLVNRDRITGEVKSIQDGKMSFQSTLGPIEVPLERIEEIQMAGVKTEMAPRQARDVRLTFLDKGSVLLHIEEWNEGQISVNSPNFGQAKLSASAFGELDFNLDKKRIEPEEEEMGLSMEP